MTIKTKQANVCANHIWAMGSGFFHLKEKSRGKASSANFLSSALQSGVRDQNKELLYKIKSSSQVT